MLGSHYARVLSTNLVASRPRALVILIELMRSWGLAFYNIIFDQPRESLQGRYIPIRNPDAAHLVPLG